MKTNAIFVHLLKTMTYRSNYEIQGKINFFDSDEHLRREWKHRAKMNIKQQIFLEGILLKSLDHESKFFYHGRLFEIRDQDSLLVKLRNGNHSPGPVIRKLAPSSH